MGAEASSQQREKGGRRRRAEGVMGGRGKGLRG